MLMHGRKIEGPNEEIIVIPRPEEPIVFTARAVLDMSEFDDLCPRPKPGVRIMRGGERVEETDNPTYKAKLDDYGTKRLQFIVLKSLEATEGLEWETVDLENPHTWGNYEEELKNSGFSEVEVNRIVLGVLNANSLNEAKLEQARKLFLQERQAQKDLASQMVVQNSSSSGEAVNV